jgi:hypothetical protein
MWGYVMMVEKIGTETIDVIWARGAKENTNQRIDRVVPNYHGT